MPPPPGQTLSGIHAHGVVAVVSKLRVAQGRIVTQADLNTLQVGNEFDMAKRYAEILTTVFVTLFYSRRAALSVCFVVERKPRRHSGMPLLVPLAAGALTITYWVDKV